MANIKKTFPIVPSYQNLYPQNQPQF